MSKLPKIALRLGNVFEYKPSIDSQWSEVIYLGENSHNKFFPFSVRHKFSGCIAQLKNMEVSPTGEKMKLIGITPTNLAEMARENSDEIEFVNSGDFWGIDAGINNFTKNKDESLEAFMLRVAIERGYLIPQK